MLDLELLLQDHLLVVGEPLPSLFRHGVVRVTLAIFEYLGHYSVQIGTLIAAIGAISACGDCTTDCGDGVLVALGLVLHRLESGVVEEIVVRSIGRSLAVIILLQLTAAVAALDNDQGRHGDFSLSFMLSIVEYFIFPMIEIKEFIILIILENVVFLISIRN